jgi:hypothetical protein
VTHVTIVLEVLDRARAWSLWDGAGSGGGGGGGGRKNEGVDSPELCFEGRLIDLGDIGDLKGDSMPSLVSDSLLLKPLRVRLKMLLFLDGSLVRSWSSNRGKSSWIGDSSISARLVVLVRIRYADRRFVAVSVSSLASSNTSVASTVVFLQIGVPISDSVSNKVDRDLTTTVCSFTILSPPLFSSSAS